MTAQHESGPERAEAFTIAVMLKRVDLLRAWTEAFGDPSAESQFNRYRSRWLNSLVTLGLLSGLAAAGVAAVLGVPDRQTLMAFVAVVWLAFLVYGTRFASRGFVRDMWVRQIKRALDSGDYDMYVGPSVLRFDATGIGQLRAGVSDAWFSWSEVTGVDATPAGVVARTGRTSAFIIPNSSIPPAMSAEVLVGRIRELHEASGAGEFRRLRARLAGQDTPCPSCNYNLRGATGLHCPECGRRLRIQDLPPIGDGPGEAKQTTS